MNIFKIKRHLYFNFWFVVVLLVLGILSLIFFTSIFIILFIKYVNVEIDIWQIFIFYFSFLLLFLVIIFFNVKFCIFLNENIRLITFIFTDKTNHRWTVFKFLKTNTKKVVPNRSINYHFSNINHFIEMVFSIALIIISLYWLAFSHAIDNLNDYLWIIIFYLLSNTFLNLYFFYTNQKLNKLILNKILVEHI